MRNLYLALFTVVLWGVAYAWYFIGTDRVAAAAKRFFGRIKGRLPPA